MKADPGYGDPLAPIGTPEWAKRWRLSFQTIVKDLPQTPQTSIVYYKAGQQYRAWTMLTNEHGNYYRDFDSFCRDRQPWGLGIDPAKFRAYLAAELGDKAADLETVSVDGRIDNGANQHTGPKVDSDHADPNPPEMSEPKEKRLRAILRAPAVVQELYRQGRITQTDAAKLGPMSPTPEQAARVAEARQEIEALSPDLKPGKAREEAKKIVARVMGGKKHWSPLDHLRKWWAKATQEERGQFLAYIEETANA